MISYLLDTSWLLYKGYFAFPDKEYSEIFFLLSKIKQCLKQGEVYLCLDGLHPKGRVLNESYKENREHKYNVYQKLSGVLYSLQNLSHVHIKFNDLLEADEVIFSLTRLLEGKKVILSGDNDLLQSLNEDVRIDRGKEVISEDYYKMLMAEKFYSIPPIQLPIYRSIVGDSSDNIKSVVSRFPHKLAARIATELPYNGSVHSIESLNWFKTDSVFALSSTEKKWVDRLIERHSEWQKSFSIMKLDVYSDLDNTPMMDSSNRLLEEHYRLLKSIRDLDKERI